MTEGDDRPLSGMLVVSVEQAIAAPYCTRLLADQGARVIKVERPDGGDFARTYDARVHGEASHFVWCNRSKESLALDLKDAGSLATLKKLLKRADVFVQNLAPGAAERMGLGAQDVAALNPKIVSCSISGYGSGGSYGRRKAYDLLIQAESGFLSTTGTPEAIAKAGISVVDICAGVTAYHSILAALVRRGRTGKGDYIEVPMLEAMADWMGFPMYYAYDGAPPPPRSGAGHATIYPYGPFPVADGQILFGIQNDREWGAFCREVLERPDMAEDPRYRGNVGRAGHRADIEPVILDCFGRLTVQQAMARLDAAGIGMAEVRDMAGLWAHPQLAARERWRQIDVAGHSVKALRPVSGLGWEPVMGPVPALGEHTETILREIEAFDRADEA
jgi:itaconate CoA-transferase